MHDITSDIEKQGIKMNENDQLVGMFEDSKMNSHFIYFQKDAGKCWLFECKFFNPDKKGKGNKNMNKQ